MKVTNILFGSALLLLAQPVMAANMQCPGGIVQDDLRTPITAPEVKSKCGAPTHERGLTWMYEKGNLIYTLQFDSNGNLQSLTGRMKK